MSDRDFDGNNPSYDPAKCGLEQVGYLSAHDQCYSFDEVYLWRDLATGQFYFAGDSGCSCPIPFESYTSLATLTRIPNREVLRREVVSHFGDYDDAPRPDEVDAFVALFPEAPDA